MLGAVGLLLCMGHGVGRFSRFTILVRQIHYICFIRYTFLYRGCFRTLYILSSACRHCTWIRVSRVPLSASCAQSVGITDSPCPPRASEPARPAQPVAVVPCPVAVVPSQPCKPPEPNPSQKHLRLAAVTHTKLGLPEATPPATFDLHVPGTRALLAVSTDRALQRARRRDLDSPHAQRIRRRHRPTESHTESRRHACQRWHDQARAVRRRHLSTPSSGTMKGEWCAT